MLHSLLEKIALSLEGRQLPYGVIGGQGDRNQNGLAHSAAGRSVNQTEGRRCPLRATHDSVRRKYRIG